MQTNEQVLTAVWGHIFAAALASPTLTRSAGNEMDNTKALLVKRAAQFADLGAAELLARMQDKSLGGPGGLVKHLENLQK